MIKVALCPSPELYPIYHNPNATVIVVDVFRASTSIVTALHHGADAILPVKDTQEAQNLGKKMGYGIAAERNVKKCDFAEFGNDPFEFTAERVKGRKIVFSTTNGTRAVRTVERLGVKNILIGALINLCATARFCEEKGIKDIVVLAAGWNGKMSIEDCLYAGALSTYFEAHQSGTCEGDAATVMHDLWKSKCSSLQGRLSYVRKSEHYKRLVDNHLENSVEYCLQTEGADCVAKVEIIDGQPWIKKY
ncbi:2-phosphosulfolactate phosphatase [Porphyromonas pogonae]|uniref:2-phosphosulfolactate phosphatase n=1 Tax=Porphyromonas pogonae TaxID=867595 RepID=UPI002E79CA68|nr:2-phosphosulfolactate phosphatase [Porphyromonas pogonae]